jgi:hypothetical protein
VSFPLLFGFLCGTIAGMALAGTIAGMALAIRAGRAGYDESALKQLEIAKLKRKHEAELEQMKK